MDFNLKQYWRDHESENVCEKAGETPSSAHHVLPKLVLNSLQPQHQQQPGSSAAALPLFASEPAATNLSAYSSDDSTMPSATRAFNRIGSPFSLAQWQELELQALIFRHMIAGAAVPQELLYLVKRSILSPPPPSYYISQSLNHSFPHYQPALVQSGYWGRSAMDPEPGRCRRTDGKKWRCSRDVVAGQKYCERHVHRGRNRSRKPVEMPTSAPTLTSYGSKTSNGSTWIQEMAAGGSGGSGGAPLFTLSGASPSLDVGQSNQRVSDMKDPFHVQTDGQQGGLTLRHFFDGWPRSYDDSTTNLSISIPGNPSSDFSLKLGTGGPSVSTSRIEGERDRPQLSWGGTWEGAAAPMGGPLAEALRSSNSSSSSTGMLHRLQRAAVLTPEV